MNFKKITLFLCAFTGLFVLSVSAAVTKGPIKYKDAECLYALHKVSKDGITLQKIEGDKPERKYCFKNYWASNGVYLAPIARDLKQEEPHVMPVGLTVPGGRLKKTVEVSWVALSGCAELCLVESCGKIEDTTVAGLQKKLGFKSSEAALIELTGRDGSGDESGESKPEATAVGGGGGDESKPETETTGGGGGGEGAAGDESGEPNAESGSDGSDSEAEVTACDIKAELEGFADLSDAEQADGVASIAELISDVPVGQLKSVYNDLVDFEDEDASVLEPKIRPLYKAIIAADKDGTLFTKYYLIRSNGVARVVKDEGHSSLLPIELFLYNGSFAFFKDGSSFEFDTDEIAIDSTFDVNFHKLAVRGHSSDDICLADLVIHTSDPLRVPDSSSEEDDSDDPDSGSSDSGDDEAIEADFFITIDAAGTITLSDKSDGTHFVNDGHVYPTAGGEQTLGYSVTRMKRVDQGDVVFFEEDADGSIFCVEKARKLPFLFERDPEGSLKPVCFQGIKREHSLSLQVFINKNDKLHPLEGAWYLPDPEKREVTFCKIGELSKPLTECTFDGKKYDLTTGKVVDQLGDGGGKTDHKTQANTFSWSKAMQSSEAGGTVLAIGATGVAAWQLAAAVQDYKRRQEILETLDQNNLTQAVDGDDEEEDGLTDEEIQELEDEYESLESVKWRIPTFAVGGACGLIGTAAFGRLAYQKGQNNKTP